MLQEAHAICSAKANSPIAFLSTQTNLNEFLKLTTTKAEHLVYDFTEKTNEGHFLNATISILLASLLFMDLPDKSLYRHENQPLDIHHIRKMIIPFKYRYNVKHIYIDNFESIGCTLMGRDKLWKTNPSNERLYEDWKDRQMEYKTALLFYMSRKFDVNFHIGMTWYRKEKVAKDIRFMTYGNIYDMVDQIECL